MQKRSYPNYDEYMPQQASRDLNKWISAVRDINSRIFNGQSENDALLAVISSWSETEQFDFQNWLKFYAGKNHMKYKTAQAKYYVGPAETGYFVPIPPVFDSKKDNYPVHPGIPGVPTSDSNDVSDDERRRLGEIHKKKILGRIQSARKLLTQDQGKYVAGDEWEKILDALNDLEKQIHKVNKKSASIYGDLILRKANMLAKEGHSQPSTFLVKLAQNLPGWSYPNDALGMPGTAGLPGGAVPYDPFTSATHGGALFNNTPELFGHDDENSSWDLEQLFSEAEDDDDSEDENDSDADDGMTKFLQGLNGEVEDVDIDDSDDDLVVTAQAALPPEPAPAAVVPAPAPPAQPNPADIEVGEDDNTDAPVKDFDSLIDAAFSNLKVQDIVDKLDELSRIFKNREIARQLSIVDMMMDRLGLSSFFPSLAEATRSALESNQYCLVRIEEVKSRLSGALDSTGTSLHDMGQEHSIDNQEKKIKLDAPAETPENDGLLAAVKQNLDSQQKKDKLKKELRKNMEESSLLENANKDKVDVESPGEDLAKTPAPVVTPTAPQTAPPQAPVK